MEKLTRDEEKFISRICVRLYDNPMEWRSMRLMGMSFDQIFKKLEEDTTKKRKEKDNEDQLQKQPDVQAIDG